jgi:hypothetical protein
MSQNSLVIPTSGTLSGLAAMQAVNAALDTLNTLASGASAPSSPEAGQFWHDTTNNILKLRSLDNTTWIPVVSLNETTYKASALVAPAPAIYGLTLSNDTSTPNSVIDVAIGGAADSTAAVYMRLASSMKKNVTAAWVAGTANGSLDTGSVASSKFYHVHLIYDAATGAVDLLTSLSYSNPLLPTGYTNFAPIGAMYINSGGNIQPFAQNGNEFLYVTGFQDVGGVQMANTPTAKSLTVPSGLKVNAQFRARLYNSATANTFAALFYSPDEGAQTPTISAGAGNMNASLVADAAQGGNLGVSGDDFNIRTNTSGQIMAVSNQGASVYFLYGIWTKGFIYPRGLI